LARCCQSAHLDPMKMTNDIVIITFSIFQS
jgi:hypothetical protein